MMSAVRAVVTLALASMATFPLLVACASGPLDAGPSDSATGGIALTLFAERGENSYTYHTVEPDGALGFGGGFDAIDRRTTWNGRMTDEEITEMRQVLQEHNLYQRVESESDDAASSIRYLMNLAWPAGQITHDVDGENSRIRPLYEVLERASSRRVEPFLKALPEPGDRQ